MFVGLRSGLGYLVLKFGYVALCSKISDRQFRYLNLSSWACVPGFFGRLFGISVFAPKLSSIGLRVFFSTGLACSVWLVFTISLFSVVGFLDQWLRAVRVLSVQRCFRRRHDAFSKVHGSEAASGKHFVRNVGF